MLKIPFKYDVGQIIASLKGKDPRLWEALNNLNNATRDLNSIVGNIRALAVYERITFKIPATSVGTDVARYVVRIPVDPSNVPIGSQLNLTGLIISTKVASAGDICDVRVSNDRGTTWRSILKDPITDATIVYTKAEIKVGLTLMQYGLNQFNTNALFNNDFLRADFVSGTATNEITLDLIGNYTF